MSWKVVIGLEVHSELSTNSKCFCSCKNKFGGEPNTNCCPVCTGMPGALPVLNQKAVEYAIRMGLAVGCKINQYADNETNQSSIDEGVERLYLHHHWPY